MLTDDGVDRGLIFVCFQADIWRQFETIQALWIDDGDPFGLGADKDFLVGEPHGTTGKMTIPGPPAVLPQAAAALRHAARRRVPLPAVDDRAAAAGRRRLADPPVATSRNLKGTVP